MSRKQVQGTLSSTDGLRIQLLSFERSPGRLLHRANMAMRSGLLRTVRESGFELTIEEWVVLSSLWEFGEMTQSDLGDRVGKDRHFVSRLLDSLEMRRLIRRMGTKDDRRIKRVGLTAEGQRAKNVLSRALERYLEQIFAGFSQAQFAGFLQSLEMIVDWHSELHADGRGEALPAVLPGSEATPLSNRRPKRGL